MKLSKMPLANYNADTTVHKKNIFSFFLQSSKRSVFLYLINDLSTDPNITY